MHGRTEAVVSFWPPVCLSEESRTNNEGEVESDGKPTTRSEFLFKT
jgi:hypothetical protein